MENKTYTAKAMPITTDHLKESMQCYKTALRYVLNHIETGTELYAAFDTVFMRAFESMADTAEQLGFDSIMEADQVLNSSIDTFIS